MKKSISKKLFLTISGTILFIIVLYFILNTFILDDYYIGNKKKELVKAYKVISKYYEKSTEINDESFQLELEKIAENRNVNITILDSNGNIVYNSGRPMQLNDNEEMMPDNVMQNPFNMNGEEIFIKPVENFKNYTFKKELDKNSSYSIDLYSSDKLKSDFIILDAKLANGSILTLRSSVETIQESAKISNEFLIIVGVISIIVGGILAFVVSKEFTKPIQELSNISQSMANLDFSKKYIGKTEDELAILGKNINKMSEKLENTINDLKEANIELEKDIEKKSKVDEMRKQFLSDVSHELKTPIALIQGYAEGLVENVADDEESRDYYCRVIMDEAEKMDKLVKQLLTLSKIEYGSQEPDMEEFNIVKLVNTVIKRTSVMANGISINVILKDNPNTIVIADEFMIEQVVTNYVTNAIKNVDENKKIEITIENIKDSKIRVSVYNTGKNIPEDKINKLWDRFYKLDASRNRENGGTGIGLALVKAIISKHNNNYGVENVENGIVFYFELDSKN